LPASVPGTGLFRSDPVPVPATDIHLPQALIKLDTGAKAFSWQKSNTCEKMVLPLDMCAFVRINVMRRALLVQKAKIKGGVRQK
jgi:hypothetical protein